MRTPSSPVQSVALQLLGARRLQAEATALSTSLVVDPSTPGPAVAVGMAGPAPAPRQHGGRQERLALHDSSNTNHIISSMHSLFLPVVSLSLSSLTGQASSSRDPATSVLSV